jgi:sec-independent protein translocase protein TatA
MFLATSTLHPTLAAFYGLGGPELLIIVFVLLLLFGGRKLPEMARGTGRALRIFKAETKGLMDDDDTDTATSTPQRTTLPSASSPAGDTVPPVPPPSAGASGTTGATAAPEVGTSSPASDGLPPTHTET